jgi:hypothetical protein
MPQPLPNRDDHAKNFFSFLLNDRNAWGFAPANDLTFSDCPAGVQSIMVMGEGKPRRPRPGTAQSSRQGTWPQERAAHSGKGHAYRRLTEDRTDVVLE